MLLAPCEFFTASLADAQAVINMFHGFAMASREIIHHGRRRILFFPNFVNSWISSFIWQNAQIVIATTMCINKELNNEIVDIAYQTIF